MTFGVILVTLVVQGLTLPPLVRPLGLAELSEDEREEHRRASRPPTRRSPGSRRWPTRRTSPRTWSSACATSTSTGPTTPRPRSRLRADGDAQEHAEAFRQLGAELISAERAVMVDLRERGELDGEVLRRIERDLDLEESRLEE